MFDVTLDLISISAYLFFIALGLILNLRAEDIVLKLIGSIFVFVLSLSLATSGLVLIGSLGMFLGVILFFVE